MAWGAGDTTEAGIRPDAGAVLALLACLAAAATIQFPLPLNHDAAWHFYTSLRVLAGDELGREIFDINPPMSAWLFLPAALVVEATGLSPSVVFKAFTLLVSFIWALWTCRLAGAFDALAMAISSPIACAIWSLSLRMWLMYMPPHLPASCISAISSGVSA